MDDKIECGKCKMMVCDSSNPDKVPLNCPTRTKQDVIQQVLVEYDKPEVREFARQASIQTAEGYMQLPEGRTPRNPRVEEVAQFAKKMGYKKLGIAFCNGLRNEAELLITILENRGFDVVSVCCKAGGIPEERIGIEPPEKKTDIKDEQREQGPGGGHTMCSPITQAEILNDAEVDFNIVVGLCVGHDSLFFKYAKAPITVLIAKDRVFGHNPAAGLYLSHSYYRKLLRKDSLDS